MRFQWATEAHVFLLHTLRPSGNVARRAEPIYYYCYPPISFDPCFRGLCLRSVHKRSHGKRSSTDSLRHRLLGQRQRSTHRVRSFLGLCGRVVRRRGRHRNLGPGLYSLCRRNVFCDHQCHGMHACDGLPHGTIRGSSSLRDERPNLHELPEWILLLHRQLGELPALDRLRSWLVR